MASVAESEAAIFTFQMWKNYLVHDLEIGKIVLVVCFVLVGGFLFAGRETTQYSHFVNLLNEYEREMLEDLENLTGKFPNDKAMKDLIHKRVLLFVKNYEKLPDDDIDMTWTLSIAMYYSFVMITTIGTLHASFSVKS